MSLKIIPKVLLVKPGEPVLPGLTLRDKSNLEGLQNSLNHDIVTQGLRSPEDDARIGVIEELKSSSGRLEEFRPAVDQSGIAINEVTTRERWNRVPESIEDEPLPNISESGLGGSSTNLPDLSGSIFVHEKKLMLGRKRVRSLGNTGKLLTEELTGSPG